MFNFNCTFFFYIFQIFFTKHIRSQSVITLFLSCVTFSSLSLLVAPWTASTDAWRFGNLIPREPKTRQTWQPRRYALTANFNGLNVMPGKWLEQNKPFWSYDLTLEPTWPIPVTSCRRSPWKCIVTASTSTRPHFLRFLCLCTRPPIGSERWGLALWAALIRHHRRERTSAPSLLHIHLGKLLCWISFCLTDVIGGSQPMQSVSNGAN